ncbi:MAG: toast rack family protein [Longimicrobiales bacterium]
MRKGLITSLVVAAAVPTASAAQMRTVTMSRQLEDQEPVRVSVEYGAGRFGVRAMDTGLLYRMSLVYDEDRYEPVAEYSDHRLDVGVESIRNGFRGNSEGGRLDLELARGVPMDLDLEFGAVRADVDLGGLALTGLDLSTGASESIIDVSEPNETSMDLARFEVGAADFTARRLGNLNAERIEVDAGVGSLTLGLDGEWNRDTRLGIDMGLGALELRVPEGLGLQLRKDSFLTSLDSEGLVKRGEVYQSLNWDQAARKVIVDLDAAFGSVKVVWVRP